MLGSPKSQNCTKNQGSSLSSHAEPAPKGRKSPGLLFQPYCGYLRKPFLFREFRMLCLKARGQDDRPTAPAQATFLLIPEALTKGSRVPGLSSCSPDPRQGVETRHKVSGRKGNISMALYNIILGVGRRCKPPKGCLPSPGK